MNLKSKVRAVLCVLWLSLIAVGSYHQTSNAQSCYAYGYGFHNTCYPIASNACISEVSPEANYCEFTHCDYAYPPFCMQWGAHDGGFCKSYIDSCFGAPQWNACTC